MMLSAKIAMRSMAPPANMLNMPRMPEDWALEGLGESDRIDAGDRDVGAEPIDEQRRQREPDALLQLLGLGEGAEIQIGGKLFGGGNHCSLSLARGGAVRHPPSPAGCLQHGAQSRPASASAAAAPETAANARPGSRRSRRACSAPPGALIPRSPRLSACRPWPSWRRSSCAWPRRPRSTFFSISVTEPPAFSTAALAVAVAWLTVSVEPGLQLALAQQPNAVQRAADEAGRHQRRDVDRLARIEHARVHRLPAGGRG